MLAVLLPRWPPAAAFVIAPPWADPATNPCSEASWQLVFWPDTQSCYQIFSRGPCPATQVAAIQSWQRTFAKYRNGRFGLYQRFLQPAVHWL